MYAYKLEKNRRSADFFRSKISKNALIRKFIRLIYSSQVMAAILFFPSILMEIGFLNLTCLK
jgi:hypothetical protein